MGFWGPTIRSRLVGNREEWYGTCETCKEEHTGRSEGKVKAQMRDCERAERRATDQAKKEERREASRKAERQRKEEEREEKRRAFQDRQDAERKERERKARDVKKALLATKRQVKAAKKGAKCPFCRKSPCNNSKPQCSQVTAAGLQSAYDMLDAGDPARFDDQLRWARDNLGL